MLEKFFRSPLGLFSLTESVETPWVTRIVVAMGILGALTIGGAAGYNASIEYDREIEAARESIGVLTDAMTNNVLAALTAIDQALEYAAVRYDEDRARDPASEASNQAFLLSVKKGLPFVRGLGWFDKDGERVASSFGVGRPPLNISGESNFEIHRDGRHSGVFIGKPILASGLPGEWIVPVSRRISGHDGSFAGAVNGVADVQAIFGHYSDAIAKSDLRFTLYHRDGVLIARAPPIPEAIGRDFASSELFKTFMPKSENGIVEMPSPVANEKILVGYRQLPGFPLVLMVARPVENISVDWRFRQAVIFAFVVCFWISIAIGSTILVLQYRHILRRQRESIAAQRLLQVVIDNVPDSISFKDRDLRFLLVNQACAKFFGQPREKMIGRRLSDLTLHLKVGLVDNSDRRVLESGNAEYRQIITGIDPERRAKTWWATKVPLFGGDGEPFGILTVAQDVTDLMNTNAALEQRTSELIEANTNLSRQAAELEQLNVQFRNEKTAAQQANRAKSEFLANMSHELRTPLNAIIGFSEVLAAQIYGTLPLRYLDYSKDILGSGKHLLDVINDILDMSRIEAGHYDLKLSNVNVARTVEAALKIVGNRAENKQQTLRFQFDGDLPVTRTDSRAIKQIIVNLVGNAIKFTPPQGAIHVQVRPGPDKRIEILVGDNGPGIRQGHISHVFDPFWQAEESRSRRHEGTGLGLAICKNLVDLLGGTIRLESVYGEGTTVTISLPVNS